MPQESEREGASRTCFRWVFGLFEYLRNRGRSCQRQSGTMGTTTVHEPHTPTTLTPTPTITRREGLLPGRTTRTGGTRKLLLPALPPWTPICVSTRPKTLTATRSSDKQERRTSRRSTHLLSVTRQQLQRTSHEKREFGELPRVLPRATCMLDGDGVPAVQAWLVTSLFFLAERSLRAR